jgi:predicted dehydrogenase
MKKYQVGVIGAGWIAKAHMRNLQNTGRVDIRWIAARNPEKPGKGQGRIQHSPKVP